MTTMMISKQDIIEYINNNYPDIHLELNSFKNNIIDELLNIFNIISINQNDFQLKSQRYFIETVVDELSEKYKIFYERQYKLNELLKLKLPEQRSPEWHLLRQNILTASSFAAAMDKCHFRSRDELIYSKIIPEPYESNPITEWGVKYEEIATLFYQSITGTVIKEFGMIPHPTFPIFGASPDGICDDTGPMEFCSRMLEIKCPPKRKFTKSVPPHYMMQMQGQLEVCDLDECDFLQVKLEEYDTLLDYKNDIFDSSEPYKSINEEYDNIINGKTKENLPKGVTISYVKEGDASHNLSYLYPKLYQTHEQYLEWIDEYIKKGYNIVETKWWKITRYELSLVHRDKLWWNDHIEHIIKFYNDYIEYKSNPDKLNELKAQINNKKKKKKNEIFIPAKLPPCAFIE
jgi:putative phage-type endonuclease|uniref:YqaJ viral recombinase domain-containing protein n=1 Tax=viral metagenome TaxID=1070528 RepID=A0A6C0C8B3_9ZZZZ